MSFAKYYSDGRRENAPASVDAGGRVIGAGFDEVEGVSKVAMLAWNPSALAWERMTTTGGTTPQSGSGTVSTTATAKTKRIDQATSETLYIGEADPGSLSSALVWRIRRITLTPSGDPVAIEYAVSGTSTAAWDDRASISYS